MDKSLPEKIAARIRQDYIESALGEQGGKMPTVRQLCDRYGVSKSTVSYALSMLQQQKMIWKRQGSGIRILSKEEREAGLKPRSLGFLIPWVRRNELTMDLYEGVAEAAGRAGYQMVSGCSGTDYQNEKRQIQEMRQTGCEGVILYPVLRSFSSVHLEDDFLTKDFQDFPIVLVDCAYSGQKRTMVVFDNYHAAYRIVEKLLEEGHRRIAYVTPPCPDSPVMNRAGRDRTEAIVEALNANQVPMEDRFPWATEWQVADPHEENFDWLRRWKKMSNRPTALIARQDHQVVSLTHGCRELGIQVPEELRLVGFDNLSVGKSVHPPFPTTAPDFHKAGCTAVRALLEEVRGEVTTPGRYVLEVPVLWRTEEAVHTL